MGSSKNIMVNQREVESIQHSGGFIRMFAGWMDELLFSLVNMTTSLL